MIPIEKLERDLAYSAARSDIECCCVRENVVGKHAGIWYRSTDVSFQEDIDVVKNAIRYLEYRGFLERHPENQSLIRPLRANSG